MLTATLLVCAMMALAAADDELEVHVNETDHVHDRHQIRTTCKTDWTLYDGRCFHFVPTQMTWAKAQQNCLALDATLASIHSAEEYAFIQGLTTEAKLAAWVGLSACQEEYAWFWTDSTLADKYHSWCQAQPDGQIAQCCVQINTGGGKCWDDVACDTLNPSVCVLK